MSTRFSFRPTTARRRSAGARMPGEAGRPRRFWLLTAVVMAASNLLVVAETNAAVTPSGWLTQPMSLVNAINLLLLHNSAILKARSDLEAAHGIAIQTRAVVLPKLRGASDYTHTEAVEEFPFSNPSGWTGTRISPPRNEWSGEIRLAQSIYQGGG